MAANISPHILTLYGFKFTSSSSDETRHHTMDGSRKRAFPYYSDVPSFGVKGGPGGPDEGGPARQAWHPGREEQQPRVFQQPNLHGEEEHNVSVS